MHRSKTELTIILPIIDRLETFDAAMHIGLGQSLTNIELIVALSGASEELLESARSWSCRDERVVIVGAPASPNKRTGIARHIAIETARSDKILILQDDDDWHEDHAASMSELLDRAPIGINPVRAVTLSQRQMAWHPALHLRRNRERTQKLKKKSFYEAHYGFRRSFYQRLGVRWDLNNLGEIGSSGILSRHILDNAIEVEWASSLAITSWSLNSPLRRLGNAAMTNAERAEERNAWRKRRSRGEMGVPIWIEHFSTHVHRLESAPHSYEEAVQEFGLREVGLERGTPEDDELRCFFSGFSGSRLNVDSLVPLVANVLETGQNYFLNTGMLNLLLARSGRAPEASEIALNASMNEIGLRKAMCLAFAAFAEARANAHDAAVGLWTEACAVDSRIASFAAPVAAHIARKRGDEENVKRILAPYVVSGVDLPPPLQQFRNPEGLRNP